MSVWVWDGGVGFLGGVAAGRSEGGSEWEKSGTELMFVGLGGLQAWSVKLVRCLDPVLGTGVNGRGRFWVWPDDLGE